jgi:hypothetical protein
VATIVWDRDDVLNDLMRSWLEHGWKPAHPGCGLSYEDLTENPPHRLLGVERKEYLASLDGFRLSERAADLEPVPEVLAWFKKYGSLHRHLVLTATTLESAPAAAAWTFRHFGAWVRSFHLIPAAREGQSIPRYEEDKGAYLRWLRKGDVLVDDSPANLESARRCGLEGVLIPRPWNQGGGSVSGALERLLAVIDSLPRPRGGRVGRGRRSEA